jgi:hypothetical protein
MERSPQTHVFCDASEKAYGAALYVRSTKEDGTFVRLACSKKRLASVKRVTLPKLELLVALVGARLLSYFCEATGCDLAWATLWTDPTVALSWVQSDPNRWKTFVCNRITEIQSRTSPTQWRHCPGRENPADHLSRGLMGDQIQSLNIWWQGPQCLGKHEECWPSGTFVTTESLPEEKKRSPHHVLTATVGANLIDTLRFSSYWKLIRPTAWVLRFLQNTRRREKSAGELTAAARLHWVRVVQRETFTPELDALQRGSALPNNSKIARYNPFLEDGLICLGCRIQCSDLSKE